MGANMRLQRRRRAAAGPRCGVALDRLKPIVRGGALHIPRAFASDYSSAFIAGVAR